GGFIGGDFLDDEGRGVGFDGGGGGGGGGGRGREGGRGPGGQKNANPRGRAAARKRPRGHPAVWGGFARGERREKTARWGRGAAGGGRGGGGGGAEGGVVEAGGDCFGAARDQDAAAGGSAAVPRGADRSAFDHGVRRRGAGSAYAAGVGRVRGVVLGVRNGRSASSAGFREYGGRPADAVSDARAGEAGGCAEGAVAAALGAAVSV